MLHTSWEDMAILVAGPRTQKTTAYAIPALLAAPVAALTLDLERRPLLLAAAWGIYLARALMRPYRPAEPDPEPTGRVASARSWP